MSRNPLGIIIWIVVGCLFLAAPALAQGDGEKVIYTKEFPGSHPPFQKVVIPRSGPVVYTDAEDGSEPIEFEIPSSARQQIFDLARELGYFSKKLESGLKVANMGTKTLSYEGSQKHSQSYNYTAEPAAQKLQTLFEKITDSQRLFIRLEYSLQFDRLGVNDALLSLSAAVQQDRLLGTSHMLPLLDQIINSKRYMNISRSRADAVARAIRAANGQEAQ